MMVTIAWAGHPITWGARYWPVFLVVAALGFLVPEGYALAVHQYGNTLSDFSRWQLGEYPGEPFWAHDAWWYTTQAMFLVLAGWLLGHIWYGIWG